MENIVQRYRVFNPKKENCPVCAVFNSIHGTDPLQGELEIPEEAGKGYCRRVIVRPSMEINISDITFHESLTMRGRPDNPVYCLAFCLGEVLRWHVEGNKKEFEIGCGESYIFNGNQGDSICTYDPGQHFWGLTVQLGPEVITGLIRHIGKDYSHIGQSYGSRFFYKRKYSSAIRLILNQIIDCPYCDSVKRIYLEGKILELIAVYMDELIHESEALCSPLKLSSSDIKSLHRARRVLDENMAAPPTIGKLARLVCLNEYKLKTGFRELFGMPVHAYIIDRRLETARHLMADKKLRVTEAVQLVGYSDASHFAEKFKKKYGINPSECVKGL